MMRPLVLKLLFLWLLCVGVCSAQDFDRLYPNSIQPALSQPLQWVGVANSAASTLPEAFINNPGSWSFEPYAPSTVLPTSEGNNVWARFTLAAAETQQSWIVRVPKTNIEKVTVFSLGPNGLWTAQSAGMSIAPRTQL
jgi:hypothetical protein